MAKNVHLILLEDVENLGMAGEEVHVAPGYARNFLLPRNLAAKITPVTLRILAARKEKIEAGRRDARAAAEKTAKVLAEMVLNILEQSSEDGALYGSVTARAISDALSKLGVTIEAQRIRLEAPIRHLGEYTVSVKLHADVYQDLKLNIERA